MTLTECPSSSSDLANLPPTKPAAPVTTMLLVIREMSGPALMETARPN
jgi:hypothetical protein